MSGGGNSRPERSGPKDVEAADDVGASGIRSDHRETTPAPAAASGEWDALPSERPTSVPDYDVAALAFETSLRHQALSKLPLDVAVPKRTRVDVPSDLELRASFLLLHVDGHSSVREIAGLTGIPVEEVLTALLRLTAAGLVDIGAAQHATVVPHSGERKKTDE